MVGVGWADDHGVKGQWYSKMVTLIIQFDVTLPSVVGDNWPVVSKVEEIWLNSRECLGESTPKKDHASEELLRWQPHYQIVLAWNL